MIFEFMKRKRIMRIMFISFLYLTLCLIGCQSSFKSESTVAYVDSTINLDISTNIWKRYNSHDLDKFLDRLNVEEFSAEVQFSQLDVAEAKKLLSEKIYGGVPFDLIGRDLRHAEYFYTSVDRLKSFLIQVTLPDPGSFTNSWDLRLGLKCVNNELNELSLYSSLSMVGSSPNIRWIKKISGQGIHKIKILDTKCTDMQSVMIIFESHDAFEGGKLKVDKFYRL